MLSNKKKGPLIFTTALLFGLPVCFAESALAATTASAFSTSTLQSRLTQQTELQTLIRNLPKTSQGLWSLPFKSLPSQEQIDSLESILATYQQQVQQLTQQISELPTNNAELTAALQVAQARVATLQTSIQELKDIRAAYETHKDTLKAATDSYNEALLTQQTIQTQYDQLLATHSSNQATAEAARTALTSAETALTAAKARLNTALNDFTEATNTKQTVQTQATRTQAALDLAVSNYSEASANFQTATSNLATAQAEYDAALDSFDSSDSSLLDAFTELNAKKSIYDSTLATFNEADASLTQQTSLLASAQAAYDTASTNLDAALDALDLASSELTTANNNLATAETNLFDAQVTLNEAQQTVTTTASQLTAATSNRATAAANLSTAYDTKNAAQQNLIQASTNLNNAQNAYDTQLIPDPNWTAPVSITPVSYTIPDANFTTGNEWTGDGSSQQGLPEIHSGHLHYSYVGTEVYQDIQISPRQIANYDFKVSVYNQDTNRIGAGDPIPDTYGLRIYFYDANNNLIHQNSVTSNAVHSWQDVTLQGDTGTTVQVSRVRIAVYGIDNGFWAGTYGPAMNNVRLTLGWATPTTVQQTMNVNIGEGGQGTFTAPSGYTFTGSNLRYESINNPACGATVTPNVNGLSTVTLQALNSVWGDTCGGQVKRLYGTLTYGGAPTAPLIKDPAKLVLLQQAQAVYNDKLSVYNAATADYNTKLAEDQTAATALTTAQQNYNSAVTSEQQAYDDLISAQEAYDDASAQLPIKEDAVITAINNLTSAQQIYDAKSGDLLVATSNYDSALVAYNLASAALTSATQERDAAQATYNQLAIDHQAPSQRLENATAALATAQSTYDTAQQLVDSTFSALEAADEENSQNQIALTSATNTLKATSEEYSNATSDVAAKQTIKDDAVALLTVAENNALTSQQEVEEVNVQLLAAKATTAKLYTLQTSAQQEVDAALEKVTKVSTRVQTTKEEVSIELPALKTKVVAEVEKQAKPIEGSKEIPVVLTPENLMEINLEKVDPTELTEEQAEQLKEAALETFETAVAGSPEYEQALDALYLAAEQDDIVLPEELAAVPGLAAAVEVLNFLGNAGADMSPKVREESKKIVVTAVVAAGVAVQSAAAAATSAAASASAPSGGGSRRVGK